MGNEELQTSILSKLQEIADEYGIEMLVSHDKQHIYFTKVDTKLFDPRFSYMINWDTKRVTLWCVDKTFDLVNIESYTRLMASVIG